MPETCKDSSSAPAAVWHAVDTEEAVKALDSHSAQGLATEVAASRLAEYGPNRIPEGRERSTWDLLRTQFVQPLIVVLVVAGAVTLLLQDWLDAGVILGVVVVNAMIGFIQEGRAGAALKALQRSIATDVTVLRDGRRVRLPSDQLVPGDMVILAAGDRVPADLRLLITRNLRTDEAALTGESLPVDKHHRCLPEVTAVAERGNMGFGGTTVVAGSATGMVIATGAATETGKIAQAISAAPAMSTPLTRHLAAFSNRLLVAIGALAAVTFAVGIARGEGTYDMFMAAVALAVGAIPEGLPAAVTVTLAIGVSRMAHRRAVIRRMPAVEALGSTTVICSDKTGTLTENEMTVREVVAGRRLIQVSGNGYQPEGRLAVGGEQVAVTGALRELVMTAILCNDAGLHRSGRHWQISGDPTEAALLVFGRKAGMDEESLRHAMPRLDELPFSSEAQTMATLDEVEGERFVHLKGAFERVLPLCTGWLDMQGSLRPLDAAERADLAADAERMAGNGLRVIGLARCRLDASGERDPLGQAMRAGCFVFLGLVGMIDPPRPAAITAVRSCQRAGISVRMITGDHAATALAVARQLGIADHSAGTRVMTGSELAKIAEPDLPAAVAGVCVFARIEPAQKLRLVMALQAGGAVVAMTGDGVNDAPALKAADIGVAMGRGGTEVAKEAADIVLTDDNFASIEAAIETGRGVYDNLVKFVTWTLPTNFGEGLVILAAVLAGVALPITPLQILWINMTTAVLLGMTLAFEPLEPSVMQRPPRRPGSPMLDRRFLRRIVLVSFFMLFGAFGLFAWSQANGASLAESRTIAMNVFVMIEISYLLNCRSLDRGFWTVGLGGNPWIWTGMVAMVLLQLLMTYVPAMNALFQTAPIGVDAWLAIGVVALLSSIGVGLEKKWCSP